MNLRRTYVSLLAALILVGCGGEPTDEPLKIDRQMQQFNWDNYEYQFKQGNLPDALDAIENCKKLVFKAGMPRDLQWWRERNGEQAITDLKNYMGESAARYRRQQTLADSEKIRRLIEQYQQEQIPLKEQLRARELKKKSDLRRVQPR